MSRQLCPECGHDNPGDARFCMECGAALGERLPAAPPGPARSAPPPKEEGVNWAAIVAAVLAFLSLRRASRKARGLTVLLILFMAFFVCPMACGFGVYVVDQFFGLFR